MLSLADDALVSAQRMGEWIATSPQIEEDVALGNIALDLLGQARSLLGYAGSLEEPTRDEDELAYFRDASEFRNVHLVERPSGGDFGVAMARLLVLSTYLCELYTRLQASTDETLAAVSAKAVKEVDYHVDHATCGCCGSATAPTSRTSGCRQRSTPSGPTSTSSSTARTSTRGSSSREWRSTRRACATRSTRASPTCSRRRRCRCPPSHPRPPEVGRGRAQRRLGALLAEMQALARAHPGVTW